MLSLRAIIFQVLKLIYPEKGFPEARFSFARHPFHLYLCLNIAQYADTATVGTSCTKICSCTVYLFLCLEVIMAQKNKKNIL